MNKQDLLKELCCANGISGDESCVRNIILSHIKNFATDIKIDNLGNIIAFKKGKLTPSKRLMVSAHMDEVGFIVTDITDDGFLKFSTVGGIDKKVVLGKNVTVGSNASAGVVCVKPVHLLNSEEKTKAVSIDDMRIDIGAENKKDAENYVNLGDSICFESIYSNDGKIIKAKALDDRAGCFILINLMKLDLPFDTYFAFVTREEIGLIGAGVAAFSVNPDCSLVIESTTADDISKNENPVCKVGSGAVVAFMDKSTVYDKDYYKLAFKVAKENNIKIQPKKAVAGGNDAGIIHKTRSGVKTLAISLPCRYLHSATSLISTNDLESVQKLTGKLIETLPNKN